MKWLFTNEWSNAKVFAYTATILSIASDAIPFWVVAIVWIAILFPITALEKRYNP